MVISTGKRTIAKNPVYNNYTVGLRELKIKEYKKKMGE